MERTKEMQRGSGLAIRRLTPEVMDREDLPPDALKQALCGLRRLNYFSRSAAILWQPLALLSRQAGRPLCVLDIAAGAGDVPIRLCRKAARAGLTLQIDGIDINPRMTEFAAAAARAAGCRCRFFQLDALTEDIPRGYDVITCSLFLHHLKRNDAVLLLQRMRLAAGAVLLQDLRRCRSGLLLARAATLLLSRSPVVRTDGPRSVENAFTPEEAVELAAEAGMENAVVQHRPPFRFLLSWSAS